MEKLYTMNQIAEMLELSVRTIQNYLKEGKLTGKKIGSQWRFTEKDLERLFSDESFIDEKNIDENHRLQEFLKKDSVNKPEIFSILNYPYKKDFKLKELMKKLRKQINADFILPQQQTLLNFFWKGILNQLSTYKK